MAWFLAVVAVVVMGVVAVVAAGRGGAMGEVFDDRPDSRVQADGPLTDRDLRAVRFSTAFRGYRMSEVDSLLDRLARELREARSAAETGTASGPASFEPPSGHRGRHAAEPEPRSEPPVGGGA